MTDKLLEQVSALADDELPAAEAELLLARMERDPALRDAWVRYHAVGEAMRGALRSPALTERIRAAVDAEPAPPAARHRAVSRLRPVAGLAIAASVAMLAVFTLEGPQQPVPGTVVPAAGERPATLPLLDARQVDFSGVRSPELQDQLRSYLLNHSEHAGSSRLRGMMPYVQIAAQDTRPVKTVDRDDAGEDENVPQRRD